ncbi:MAG: UDP-N-acetylmuramoyl-tripeptide--D-alanyl-D-alanine ligase [Lachnospiraceae bacterium]|nr:UDP-N-acetylmuramoyl-tripeptide--D-alanyl-D-alanine ligase [Lachnospiraceae bacterium]
MLALILLLIGILLEAILSWYVCRYNMHMFQLNTYRNREMLPWLRQNWKRQGVLILQGLLLVLGGLLKNPVLLIISYFLTGFSIYYFRFLKRYLKKKKLVFTMRVKRLLVTDGILSYGIPLLASVLCLVRFSSENKAFGTAGILFWTSTGTSAALGLFLAAFALLTSFQAFAIMLSNTINHPMEEAINRHYINDAKRILSENPDLTVIGITGSYGKTSVKFYLNTLLRDHFNVLMTPGNYNTPMGVVKTVRSSLKPTHEIFLCEMGARHVGDIKEICDIAHPDLGVITAIGPQHLDTFFNMENIVKTKFELADALPKKGKIFLNMDNDYIKENAKKYRPEQIVSYSTGSSAASTEDAKADKAASASVKLSGYRAENIEVSRQGTGFTFVTPSGESQRYQMRLIGAHNVINVVGALAVAYELGMSLEELRVPVRRIQPVEHRMQMRENALATIIDDAYNSNPVGSKAAVETLKLFDGLRILVTPGMIELGDRQEEFNYKFGTYAADCCDYILTVGHANREAIRKGALDSGFPEKKLYSFTLLEDAMKFAYQIKDRGHKYILLENDLPDQY